MRILDRGPGAIGREAVMRAMVNDLYFRRRDRVQMKIVNSKIKHVRNRVSDYFEDSIGDKVWDRVSDPLWGRIIDIMTSHHPPQQASPRFDFRAR